MKPAVVLQTDFTRGTTAVATMYGVADMIDPTLRIFDLTHDIPSFDTYVASISLLGTVEYWAPGTVFVSVVDPTVGTDRKASVAKLSNGAYVVTPDNGSLTHLKKYFGIEEVRIIDEEKNRLQSTTKVSIFHGRDLFTYCAAKLASGQITWEEVGPSYPVEDIIEHNLVEASVEDGELKGMIAYSGVHFGLVASNISCELFEEQGIVNGDKVKVIITENKKTIYDEIVEVHPSFGYVKKGEPVVHVGQDQTIQLAINLGNIVKDYNIGCGPEWLISFKKI